MAFVPTSWLRAHHLHGSALLDDGYYPPHGTLPPAEVIIIYITPRGCDLLPGLIFFMLGTFRLLRHTCIIHPV